MRHVHGDNGRGERGMAMLVALFMVLILSVLGSSLIFVSRTETLSSLNYKTMSQVRYAAESGVNDTVNYLLWTYTPPGSVTDPIVNYNLSTSPVEWGGAPVVLSSEPANYAPHYPVSTVTAAFDTATKGSLAVGIGTVRYTSRATLLGMRQLDHPFIPGTKITLQRWEVTGTGRVAGAGSAEVEVSAIIEKQPVPVYKYAAFATDQGCDALSFGGGATTDSYDSTQYGGSGTPALSDTDGNVGTNGNLTQIGNTTQINGTLSTPRTGVGNCTTGNVSALTSSGGAEVTGGLVQLPQSVTFPTPPLPSPLPPTGNVNFSTCPAAAILFCTDLGGGTIRLYPSAVGGTALIGDMRIGAGTTVILRPVTYNVNSIAFMGNANIVLDTSVSSAPAIINVAGLPNVNTPIDLTGGTLTNTTFDPTRLQILYAGTRNVRLSGSAAASALIYAPNSSASFVGGGHFYGAVVAGKITDMGGASIHYDRSLDDKALMDGPPTMSAFTWKSF